MTERRRATTQLDPHPSPARLREMYRQRTGHELDDEQTALTVSRERRIRGELARTPMAVPVRWPVTIVIPWANLVSDNRKYGVLNGQMILSKPYRAAKQQIAMLGLRAMGESTPVARPLGLSAIVVLPDECVHDPCNFGKCVHDALKGVVYVDDSWLWHVGWTRAEEIDPANARAIVTISTVWSERHDRR